MANGADDYLRRTHSAGSDIEDTVDGKAETEAEAAVEQSIEDLGF